MGRGCGRERDSWGKGGGATKLKKSNKGGEEKEAGYGRGGVGGVILYRVVEAPHARTSINFLQLLRL